jgi:hypothetical protein
MRRLLAPPLLALALVTLHLSPATACINDRETARTESEFKSRYDGKSSTTGSSANPSNPRPRLIPIAATGVGVILLVGTVGLVTLNIRRGRRE